MMLRCELCDEREVYRKDNIKQKKIFYSVQKGTILYVSITKYSLHFPHFAYFVPPYTSYSLKYKSY